MTNLTDLSTKSYYQLLLTFISKNIRVIKILGLFLIGAILWFGTIPTGITPVGWHLLIIFVCSILAMVTKVLANGSLAIIIISLCSITNTLNLESALSSYSSKIIWLVFSAFLLAKGFTKTGLGSRLAYYFVYIFGKNTLGLSYSLIVTELLLSPLIPSNTARGAGIMFPIASAISKEYKIKSFGALLMKLCFHANVITSAMFMTASAANPLITSISKSFGYELSWLIWMKTALVPTLISLALLPFILFLFFPDALRKTEEIQAFAKQQIHNSGPLKKSEWIMLFTFFLLLFMWVGGSMLKIDATVSALVGLSILLLTNVLTWEDVITEKEAWNTFLWLATLLMLATNLASLGVVKWMSNQIHHQIAHYSWEAGLLLLSVIYFFGHYLLASLTSHVSALYAAFCSIAIMLGTPAPLAILVFAGISNFSSGVTHYTTGSGPLFFSTNYLTMGKWWKIGLVVGLINTFIWLFIGGWWWKFLNVW